MKTFSEGGIKFYAPEGAISKKLPVFYNPFMAFDRDLTVAITREVGGESYCDGLAGSGIRGMRAVKDAGFSELYLNDISPDAVKLIKKNLKLNDISASVSCEDVNSMLRSHKCDKLDVIDLDPFGSFIGALDSAVRALNRRGGLLCLTATDTAPLCGVSIKTCERRYDSRPIRTSYAKEVGLRILIGACARMFARYDCAMEPLFAYNHGHYFRLFLRASRGVSKADAMLKEMAYLQHCFKCDWRGYSQIDRFLDACPECAAPLVWAGPLWSGPFADVKLLKKLKTENEKLAKLIKVILSEQDITTPFYEVSKLAEIHKIPMPRKKDILEAVLSQDEKASETHFSHTGIRSETMLRI